MRWAYKRYGLKDQFVKLSNYGKFTQGDDKKDEQKALVRFQKTLMDLNNKLYFYKEEPLVKHFKQLYEALEDLYPQIPENYQMGLGLAFKDAMKE